MTTLSDLFKKSKMLENDYRNANDDIKVMIQNIFNACFRFGLNDAQTFYMIEQALKPLRNNLLEDLL